MLRLALRHVGPDSPGYLPMMRNLGHILLDAGKPDEALTVLATALAAKPDDAEMLYWWAQSLKALGREREAEVALKRVEDLEPGFGKRKETGR
jgi:predicted Zn-dependent protease